MILKIQIALTILACLFVVAVFPVAAWVSFGWGVVVALCAFLCYGGVLLCKQKTAPKEDFDEKSLEESVEEPSDEIEKETDEKENLGIDKSENL